jgi:hypothetical protein
MEFCKRQLLKMDIGYNCTVDYMPVDRRFDLVKRFRTGVKAIEAHGIDNVIVVESDDMYPDNYLKYFDFENYDIIGWDRTIYYNIRTREWQEMRHEHSHSSLCATGFKISAFKDFRWPADDFLWLDIKLWEYAKKQGLRIKLYNETPPMIGIKHGVGRVGGKGHVMPLRNKDPDLSWLRSQVTNEAFEFYNNLKF